MQINMKEDIKHQKLYKIQEAQAKINDYQIIYDQIKESSFVKISRNATSKVSLYIVRILSGLFLLTSFIFVYGEFIYKRFEFNSEIFIINELKSLSNETAIFFLLLSLLLSLLLFTLGYLIKENIKKRKILSSLTVLVEDMMKYMEKVSREEKIRYEHYIDFEAEMKN